MGWVPEAVDLEGEGQGLGGLQMDPDLWVRAVEGLEELLGGSLHAAEKLRAGCTDHLN